MREDLCDGAVPLCLAGFGNSCTVRLRSMPACECVQWGAINLHARKFHYLQAVRWHAAAATIWTSINSSRRYVMAHLRILTLHLYICAALALNGLSLLFTSLACCSYVPYAPFRKPIYLCDCVTLYIYRKQCVRVHSLIQLWQKKVEIRDHPVCALPIAKEKHKEQRAARTKEAAGLHAARSILEDIAHYWAAPLP